jgi:hypothetical protein
VRSQSPRRPSPEFGMKLPWRRCRHPYATRPTPKHMSSAAYNRIPAVTIYKTYPVYTPGREPDRASGPTPAAWNCVPPDRLHTAVDWARAGEAVFDAQRFSRAGPDVRRSRVLSHRAGVRCPQTAPTPLAGTSSERRGVELGGRRGGDCSRVTRKQKFAFSGQVNARSKSSVMIVASVCGFFALLLLSQRNHWIQSHSAQRRWHRGEQASQQ